MFTKWADSVRLRMAYASFGRVIKAGGLDKIVALNNVVPLKKQMRHMDSCSPLHRLSDGHISDRRRHLLFAGAENARGSHRAEERSLRHSFARNCLGRIHASKSP